MFLHSIFSNFMPFPFFTLKSLLDYVELVRRLRHVVPVQLLYLARLLVRKVHRPDRVGERVLECQVARRRLRRLRRILLRLVQYYLDLPRQAVVEDRDQLARVQPVYLVLPDDHVAVVVPERLPYLRRRHFEQPAEAEPVELRRVVVPYELLLECGSLGRVRHGDRVYALIVADVRAPELVRGSQVRDLAVRARLALVYVPRVYLPARERGDVDAVHDLHPVVVGKPRYVGVHHHYVRQGGVVGDYRRLTGGVPDPRHEQDAPAARDPQHGQVVHYRDARIRGERPQGRAVRVLPLVYVVVAHEPAHLRDRRHPAHYVGPYVQDAYVELLPVVEEVARDHHGEPVARGAHPLDERKEETIEVPRHVVRPLYGRVPHPEVHVRQENDLVDSRRWNLRAPVHQ